MYLLVFFAAPRMPPETVVRYLRMSCILALNENDSQ
jgi:hypothetical protein